MIELTVWLMFSDKVPAYEVPGHGGQKRGEYVYERYGEIAH